MDCTTICEMIVLNMLKGEGFKETILSLSPKGCLGDFSMEVNDV